MNKWIETSEHNNKKSNKSLKVSILFRNKVFSIMDHDMEHTTYNKYSLYSKSSYLFNLRVKVFGIVIAIDNDVL